MKVRQRRPRDAGSVVSRKRADGSESFMLKWKTYTRTVEAASKREALALLPAFVAEAQSGHIDREKAAARERGELPTLTEWSKVFLAEHVTQDPDRLATRRAYESTIRLQILPALGEHKLPEITPAMVRKAMQDSYAAGRAIRSLKLDVAVLHRMLDAAIEDGKLKAANPTPKFSKLRLGEADAGAEKAQRSALTTAQVAALLAAASDPDLRLYIAVMASCGLRPGECLGLRWRDVDYATGVLHVRGAAKAYNMPGEGRRVWIGRTKTASSVRTVAMGPALAGLFTAERKRQEAYQAELRGADPGLPRIKSLLPADACVFPADAATLEGLTGPYSPDLMRARFTRVATKAGVSVTPHGLRHTHISHAIEGGLSLADTAARAGHSSVMTTARTYVHAVNESQRRAAEIGDSLLGPAEPSAERPENGESAGK